MSRGFVAAVLLLLAAAPVSWAASASSDVTVLTPDTFDSIVDGSRHVLVEFYAPWCGHCKNLAPVYDQLATAYVPHSSNVVIASVDADAHKSLGGRYGVSGFPTIKFFPKGSTKAQDYSSGRDLDSFVNFLTEETGLVGRIDKPKEYVNKLTSDNFDAVALDKDKDVIVEFFAPWCGHCKTLAPKYEKVAEAFSRESGVVVAAIDADKHKDIAERFGISGFPTLKFFPRGTDKFEDYSGARDEAGLTKFLNDKAGTHRTVSGGLDETAGILSEFKDLTKRFVEHPAERQSILAEAEKVALDSPRKTVLGKVYQKIMQKIAGSDDGYVENEIGRLSRLVASSSVTGEKLDELTSRLNILKSFKPLK